jgi:hypothetical protein
MTLPHFTKVLIGKQDGADIDSWLWADLTKLDLNADIGRCSRLRAIGAGRGQKFC